MKTELDPKTGVPRSFWAFIEEMQGDSDAMHDALTSMDKRSLVLHFLTYVQLRADLADLVMATPDCSEDTADDVADGLVAAGHRAYVDASTIALPSRDAWPEIEDRSSIHVFDTVYYDRFGQSIWDETDALEHEYLPWDPRSG